MADSVINVVKPQSGFRMHMPKVPKVAIALITVFLALITVISAVVLYRNRAQPVVPTPTGASTTSTITDDFSAASLNTAVWQNTSTNGGTVSQTGGTLQLASPGSPDIASVSTVENVQGDLSAEVEVSDLTEGMANLCVENQTPGYSLCVRWRKLTGGNQEADLYYHLNPADNISGPISLPSATTSAKLKLVRVGTTAQGFVDTGSGYQLVGSHSDLPVNSEKLRLSTGSSATFDNFSALVNLVDAPIPTPGTEAACTYSFTILDTVPTSTPTVTPTGTITPSATPTPSSTPGPTNTPTPTSPAGATPTPTIPASCNQACTTNANCSNGLACVSGACRNPVCSTQSNCTCEVASPTPTTPIVQGPTPTPVTLQQAGVATTTWILGIGGAILVALGSLLLVAI